MRRIVFAVAVAGWPAAAFAFDAKPQPPVTLHPNADCSFGSPQGFDRFGAFGPTEGPAPRDIGSGRLAQRYISSGDSWYHNRLVVIDCNSAEAVAIGGPVSERLSGLSGSSVDDLLRPHGPLVISKNMTVDEIAARATAVPGAELTIGAELAQSLQVLEIEPFCGCGLLYPESTQAKALKRR